MSSFMPLARAFSQGEVRYLLIGVWAANFHAHMAGVVFSTHDRDVFLPPDPDNLAAAWRACEASGLQLASSGEPLDEPRDRWLAEKVIARRALTQASDEGELQIDLALVMEGFDFDQVWQERVIFTMDGIEIPVARLQHIVTSKAATGRAKDHLFIATHADSLRQLLPPEDAD